MWWGRVGWYLEELYRTEVHKQGIPGTTKVFDREVVLDGRRVGAPQQCGLINDSDFDAHNKLIELRT